MMGRMWRNWNTPTELVGVKMGITTVENWQYLLKTNIYKPTSSIFFLAVLFLGIYSTEMQTYVHQKTRTRIATAALFRRVSKMETTQMSISRIEE